MVTSDKCERAQARKNGLQRVLYRRYFSWDKIFAEPPSIILRKIFTEANFQNSFVDIHQARSKLAIVYTRDARNGDPGQVVQYYGYGCTC